MLDRWEIATKCAASWDAMAGDDRVRFCGVCAKNVYNISAMTRDETERLLVESEGHACTRLFRREDGRVLTRDCGTDEKPRFLMKLAYAAALVMPFAVGQDRVRPESASTQTDSEVRGSVVDQAGRPIANAIVRLGLGKSRYEVKTAVDGTFVLKGVKAGSYHLAAWIDGIESAHQQVALPAGNIATMTLRLSERVEVGGGAGLVETVVVPLTDRKLN